MFSGTDEPECPRRRVILSSTVAAVTPVRLPACAADGPRREATKAVTHATIHAIALGVAPVGRAPLPAATQTGGETKGATDWANSIAVS
jgi:hypothetical protein